MLYSVSNRDKEKEIFLCIKKIKYSIIFNISKLRAKFFSLMHCLEKTVKPKNVRQGKSIAVVYTLCTY